MLSSLDNIKMVSAGSIFENSLQKFVIGPVFKVGATRDDILAEVKVWVEGYKYEFLRPLLADGGSLSDIQAGTDFEREILDCLREVLK
jgi:hypothetical protein